MLDCESTRPGSVLTSGGAPEPARALQTQRLREDSKPQARRSGAVDAGPQAHQVMIANPVLLQSGDRLEQIILG